MNARRVPAYMAVWWAGQQYGRGLDCPSAFDFFLAVLFFQLAASTVLVSVLQLLDVLYFANQLPTAVAKLRLAGNQRPAPPHTFGRMAVVVLRNQLVSGGAILLFALFQGDGAGMPALFCRPDAWAVFVMATSLAYAGLFEVVFYTGHRLMHWRPLYALLHTLHHQTHADSAVSFGYMDFVDYTLETTLPALVPLWVMGVHPAAYFGFLAVGITNAIVVHSGWDFIVLPDPARHRTHHLRHHTNLGNGPLDLMLGTAASVK